MKHLLCLLTGHRWHGTPVRWHNYPTTWAYRCTRCERYADVLWNEI